MASKQVGRLVGAAFVFVLSTPLMVVGEGRKNPRDFPDGTLCPVNLGWSVDQNDGTPVPPPAQPIRPPAHTFTATGTDAEITLVACDGGLTSANELGLALWIRDFAVVRKDVYETHQALGTYPDTTCYIPRSDEGATPHVRKVGSTFAPSVSPAVNPQTLKFPFFDNFSSAIAQKKWHLDGATFETVELSDPRVGSFSGTALVLARTHDDASQNACSKASIKIKHLRKDEAYVIDFQWESKGVQSPVPDIEMLTFVDTNP